MPAPRVLPEINVLKALRSQGWTYGDIAAEYGVSEQGVYMAMRRANATRKTPGHKDLIPWRVRREHAHAFPATCLRLLSRESKGEILPPVKKRLLDKWLRDIREANVVVCYDPEQPPNPASKVGGFYYSRRRPEDGDSLIRVPVDAEVR
ncbi:hypothetical protein [Micromonospora avicenniae]|uniref:hypothetical protein n=1 Tax=Micromonospora avicenniae TaxID=1198245 RepID=UPI003328FCB6